MKRSFIGERSVGKRPASTSIVPRTNNDIHTPKDRYTIDKALDIFIQSKEAEGLRQICLRCNSCPFRRISL